MTLRAKFLLALLLISGGLTTASLVVVRRVVTSHIRAQIVQDLQNSVATFQNVQRQRESTLAHSGDLIADLPIVRALMTTQHAVTIQDVSTGIWRTSGSDLLVLADANGKVIAIQANSIDIPLAETQQQLSQSMSSSSPTLWWSCGRHLFEVAVRPIYLGPKELNRVVGFLALGSEIDEKVTRELSEVAASEVVFRADDRFMQTTLTAIQETELERNRSAAFAAVKAQQIQLNNERFLAREVQLSTVPVAVRLTVLKSLDQSSWFISHLDRVLVLLGGIALLLGAGLVWIISRTITQPLRSLVAGVRALGKSDFEFPVTPYGGDEVAQLTSAFARMRADLQQSQRQLIDSERLATIGRMASSISHDLRHHLSAIIANAEFLSDDRRRSSEREELYLEIQTAVHQMNELIDSLLEFSRTRESLRLNPSHPEQAVRSAINTIRMRSEFRDISIEMGANGTSEGAYDIRKLERVFHNLLLNACEAVSPSTGKISVDLLENRNNIEIRVTDNGRGIPDYLQHRIFEPFFTQGKANGTGLGLTVAQKIVEDHSGDLLLESSSAKGTTFLVMLPLGPRKPSVSFGTSNTAAVTP
ncbi:MAG: two-component sensor histidine kinase [Acidobacteria bacterium]|nr:MAG: two-component sensor histidine kinase [Acidobacteriota bacterium]